MYKVQTVYEPIFDIPENISVGLGEKKIGQKVSGILNYQVAEKTKNYAILKIDYFYLTPSKRSF